MAVGDAAMAAGDRRVVTDPHGVRARIGRGRVTMA
jgi:hypothetical protein